MTNQQGAPEALRPIQRYKIGYPTDEWGMRSSSPSGIPDASGSWVRYEDHVAQVKALSAAQAGVPAGYGQGVEAVAKMIEKKADDFAQQYGSDDMGALSFGRGAHADAKLDYHSSLVELADEVRTMLAAAPQPSPSPAPAEGVHEDAYPEKCPITRRPYFMTLEHPELGMVPTYGGPYDSYTIPAPEGEPTDPWHERELRCERYDHDAGWWTEGGEAIPLRIIHEDVLFSLEERAEASPAPAQPIDMVLHCPACGMQHIDASEPPVEFEPGAAQWSNPPHRSHLCHGCGHIWRPADVPTNGVQAVKTKGKADSPIATPQPAVTAGAVDARITAIEQAIRDYHYALDTRQHGGVAQDRAVNAICNAMGMHWTQGAEAARRALAAQRGGA